jgi:tetratricopeptide (TPR) repeat protein
LRYAELLIERGQPQEALEQLGNFAEYPLPPSIAFEAFFQRGLCYEALDDLGRAQANYNSALRLQPYSEEVRERLQAVQVKRSQQR